MNEGRMDRLAAEYRRFSAEEAAGRSALYMELTRQVADDRELLAILCELEPAKRQPNLLLAAVRYLYGDFARDWRQFRERFFDRRSEALELIRTHRTQTNEPARCATLLPVLASLPQPLALLEVGTSAGLCLLPDRYGYDYGDGRPLGAPALDGGGPVFRCEVDDATPVPAAVPEVAWRAGLDLAPIDVTDDESVSWLESLVWPGDRDRIGPLRAAIAVARADPPRVVQGDLRHDLTALAQQAPGAPPWWSSTRRCSAMSTTRRTAGASPTPWGPWARAGSPTSRRGSSSSSSPRGRGRLRAVRCCSAWTPSRSRGPTRTAPG